MEGCPVSEVHYVYFIRHVLFKELAQEAALRKQVLISIGICKVYQKNNVFKLLIVPPSVSNHIETVNIEHSLKGRCPNVTLRENILKNPAQKYV